MKINKLRNFFCILWLTALFALPIQSEEKKISEDKHEFNFYTGMFDFSDDGKRSTNFWISTSK